MKKILRSTYYTLVIIVFLTIAVVGLTQTRTFHNYVRTLLIAELQTLVNGEVEMGRVEGNLGTGIRIDSVRITNGGHEVFFTERLEANYDPIAFFVNKVSASRVTLLRPRIHLWRSSNREWNTSQVFGQNTGGGDTTSSPWVLDFKQIELLAATVSVTDSFALETRTAEEWEKIPDGAIDYADITLSPLTLRSAARLEGQNTSITIRSLDFESLRPRFTLEQLAGEFHLDAGSAEIKKLSIKAPGVVLTLDVRFGTNPFSIKRLSELEKTPTFLALSIDKLSFETFKRFLPGPVDFLDKQASLDVKARGTFGHLRVDEVQVRTPRSFIRIAGTIDNLHQPSNLTLNLQAQDNILHPDDARDLVPGLHLPDLRALGVMECSYSFKGRPNHFEASLESRIGAGSFATAVSLDLRKRLMVYEGEFSTSKFNLGELLGSDKYTSDLSLNGTISGSGTTIGDLTAILRVKADSSMFFGLPVKNSVLVADVADRSVRTNLLLNAGQTRIDLNGKTKFRSDDSTSYELAGRVVSLNLANILWDLSYESDLTFDLQSSGTAFVLTPIHSHSTLGFLRSSFARETFENTIVTMDYHGEDSLRQNLELRSDPFDVSVTGVFSPLALIQTFESGGTMLANALSHRFRTLDSLRATGPRTLVTPYRGTIAVIDQGLNADITISMRDFHPLGTFLGTPMAGTSDVNLHIEGNLDDLQLNGQFHIDRFALGLRKLRLGVLDGTGSFALDHLGPHRTIESLTSDIQFSAQQALVDSMQLNNISLVHNLEKDSSTYVVSGMIDSTIVVNLRGTSLFKPNRILLNLSELRVAVADYEFENVDSVDFVLGSDGIQMNALTLSHEAEAVSFNGILDPNGASDVTFSVQNFLMRNLQNFSRQEKFVEKVKDFNGVVDMNGSFSGNFDVPAFDLTLLARGVTVGAAVFGQVSGQGSYSDGLSNIFLEFRSKPEERNAQPELLISGRMPLSLGSISSSRAAQGMDLSIRSRGFRMEFLDPFVPITRNLTGTLQADLVMRGSLSEPLYQGSLTIENARFLFTPLGIVFNLNGVLLPQDRKITFKDLTLSNVPEDRVPGLIDGLGSLNIAGDLFLEGLQPKEFSIVANGQLLIMKETTRLENLPMYGNVYVASGENSLRWSGTPDLSTFTGDLLIKNANITFPPSREVVFEKSRLFTVNYVNDTLRTLTPVQRKSESGMVATNGTAVDLLPLTRDLNSEETPAAGDQRSFLDNIVYNLTIETAGLTQVRFVFNQLTNEELFADLKGRLIFTKDPSASRLTGELQVGPRSYYKYLKTLQATGKLLFTGDFSNPELDIVATYEGTYQPDTTRIGITDADKQEQKVIVRLTITGTREEPKVKMGLEVYDRDGNKKEQRADAQSDAIAFLVSGRFTDEMTQSQQAFLTTNLLGSIGSSLISGPLTDFVRSQVGYITSIDVVYSGGANRSFSQAADLRITGEVGDAVIRLGGKVFSGDLSNANVSVQFPMSSIVGSEAWRNLILEIERRVEGVESIEQRRPSNGLRLLYRITF